MAALCYSLSVDDYFIWTTTFPPCSSESGTLLYSPPFLYKVSANLSKRIPELLPLSVTLAVNFNPPSLKSC